MIILLPPSEGKIDGGTMPPIKTLNENQAVMFERMETYSDDFDKLYGVKGSALQRAVMANENILSAATCKAIKRYSGVVYDGIDYATLDSDAKKRADERIYIVSALFGLIRADTLIPNYKLKIDKLQAYKFWKPIIGKQLKEDFVIDLLPQAHRKAVYYKDGIRVEFIYRVRGDKKHAGHAGKLIKGKFVRWLLQNDITNPDKMLAFDQDGFSGERVNNMLIEFTKSV